MQITWLLCGRGLESNQGKFILDSKMDFMQHEHAQTSSINPSYRTL